MHRNVPQQLDEFLTQLNIDVSSENWYEDFHTCHSVDSKIETKLNSMLRAEYLAEGLRKLCKLAHLEVSFADTEPELIDKLLNNESVVLNSLLCNDDNTAKEKNKEVFQNLQEEKNDINKTVIMAVISGIGLSALLLIASSMSVISVLLIGVIVGFCVGKFYSKQTVSKKRFSPSEQEKYKVSDNQLKTTVSVSGYSEAEIKKIISILKNLQKLYRILGK